MLATTLLAALPFVLQAPAPAAQKDAPIETPIQAPIQTRTLERVVVIGASVAAGFGTEHSLAEAFGSMVRAPTAAVLGFGDYLFFLNPKPVGAKQVDAALDADPTLVVGIDFLFWFGYGSLDAQGGALKDESQRLELLEVGLGMLEEFECPLVIGDFPDMSAAVGTMLAPEQMPALSTLPLLSRRVREWAATRPNVLLFPLADTVRALGSEEEIRVGRYTFPAGTRFLQPDHLHPNAEGMVLTCELIGDMLVEKRLAAESELERERAAVLARLRKRPAAFPAGAGR